MDYPAVVSHAILGFLVMAALFPFSWLLANRARYAAMEPAPSLGGVAAEAYEWLLSQVPKDLSSGGFVFAALFLGAFLVGCVANVCGVAWELWFAPRIAGAVVDVPIDPRQGVRWTAYMMLLGSGTEELLREAQTMRFLYHLARAIHVCAFASFVGSGVLFLFAKGRSRDGLAAKVFGLYFLALVLATPALYLSQAWFDSTLAMALNSSGRPDVAGWLFPSFKALAPAVAG